MNDVPVSHLLTSRQAAHALGLSKEQLFYMWKVGEATPMYRMPGGDRGALLWHVEEIRRLQGLKDRRSFRRRRKLVMRDGLTGLAPVVPKHQRKVTLPPRD